MKKQILVLCLVFTLFSCQKQKYGTIVERWYEPSTTNIILIPTTIGQITTLTPYIVYDSEDWCIQVKGVNQKGDTVNRTYYVSEEAYDTLTVGKFICIDKNCDDEDNNNTKKQQ